jgi:hypothetical protein
MTPTLLLDELAQIKIEKRIRDNEHRKAVVARMVERATHDRTT